MKGILTLTPHARQRMRRAALALSLMAVSCAWAGPGAHGPNGEHLDTTTVPNTSGLARLPDGSVHIPKLAQRRMGLRTVLAPMSEASVTVELPARVVADPNASGLIQSVHGGRIEPGPRGLPVAGQAVKQGEVLAWVRHHADPYALAAQQSQRSELRAARELADQRLQRLQSLEGTVPRKDIDAARIEAASLAQRERSIASSLNAREPLHAPVSGVLARTELKAGQIVGSQEVLAEVVNPSQWLVEASTADVSLSTRLASATLQGAQGVTLKPLGAARVLRDGVLPITFRVQSAPGATLLALGQTVTVVASLSERRQGIVLPAEAVVRNPANEPVVWIKTSAERYVPQPVRVQALDNQRVLVTQGLSADNRVVVQGAALVAQIR